VSEWLGQRVGALTNCAKFRETGGVVKSMLRFLDWQRSSGVIECIVALPRAVS
jgi:hypothetical protein